MEIGAPRGVPKAGVARANLAVSNENPCGSKGPHYEKFKDYSVLQQHVLFWDRDGDGIIWPLDTYRGFRQLGFNIPFSIFAIMVINGGFSYPTRLAHSVIPDPFFRVYLDSIHKAKHASDSNVYDHEGRFVAQSFENLFAKFSSPGANDLSLKQIFNLMSGNRCAVDPYGWSAAFFEFGTTWILLQRNGKVQKEDLRQLYDGSLFWRIAQERSRGTGWSQGWGLGGDGFWGPKKRKPPLLIRLVGNAFKTLFRLTFIMTLVGLLFIYVYDWMGAPSITFGRGDLPNVIKSAWYPRKCPPHGGELYMPKTTIDVASIVKSGLDRCPIALGSKEGSDQLSIRASRQLYHSTVKFPCVNVKAGDCAMQLDMSRMSDVLSWDKGRKTITVQPSMEMDHLMDTMHELGMSMPSDYIPIFTGLTVGGMFLTGAHGSSTERPSAFGHAISRITYVDGQGEVREEDNPTRWIGTMGLLGIVTEMEIQGTEMYKLNTTVVKESDRRLPERIAMLVREPSFARVMWYPNARTAIVRWHTSVPPDTPGDAFHSFFEHRPWAAIGGKFSLAIDQINFTPLPTDWGICFFEQRPPPFWYKEGEIGHWKIFNQSIIGWPHRLGGSSCRGRLSGCYWQNQVQILVEFDMDVRYLGDWIREVRAITDLIPHQGCLPSLLGFAMRFGKGSDAPLDMAYGRDTVYIDMLVSKGLAGLPAHHQDILDEIEQITFCKYGARAHWGKNPQRAFLHPECPMKDKYPELENFLDTARQQDPRGIFVPPLFRKMCIVGHRSSINVTRGGTHRLLKSVGRDFSAISIGFYIL
ncbi:hypothetical protein DTO217A2_9198 [Paecilomyces variotii]|nr:hypothetical protein DTO217A2_9198 [Paecilomyces variotii]